MLPVPRCLSVAIVVAGSLIPDGPASANPFARAGGLMAPPAEAAPIPHPIDEPIELPTHGPPPVPPADEEPPRSRGLLIGGAVLTGLGAPAALTGAITLLSVAPVDNHAAASAAFAATVAIIPGIALLAAGIPMTIVGARRNRAWKRWQARQTARVLPSAGRTGFGTWTANLQVAF